MQWPLITYAGVPQKQVRIPVLTKEGCEEMFTNPFTAITVNNKQTVAGATGAVILLSSVVCASAGAARGNDSRRREKYVAKQHETPAGGPPSPAREQTKLPRPPGFAVQPR